MLYNHFRLTTSFEFHNRGTIVIEQEMDEVQGYQVTLMEEMKDHSEYLHSWSFGENMELMEMWAEWIEEQLEAYRGRTELLEVLMSSLKTVECQLDPVDEEHPALRDIEKIKEIVNPKMLV